MASRLIDNARLAEAERQMLTPPHEISASEAEAFLLRHFGRKAHARPLSGERDKNFLVRDETGAALVLKFYNPSEDAPTRDLQHGAMLHIARLDPGCPVPRVHPAMDGHHEVCADLAGRPVASILIDCLPGRNPTGADLGPPLRHSVGAGLGRMLAALSDYRHERAGRMLLWDSMLLGELCPLLSSVENPSLRDELEAWLDTHVRQVVSACAGLPQQMIHNDLSLSNVLVDDHQPQRLSGIIDFGDCVRAPRVNEFGVAASYYVGTEDPAVGIADLVAGARAWIELRADEIALIPALMRSRLALRILLVGWRTALFPENRAYLLRANEQALGAWRRSTHESPDEIAERVVTRLEKADDIDG